MRSVRFFFIAVLLSSCSGSAFLQQKYTYFKHAAHQRHHASEATQHETASSTAAPVNTKDEYHLPANRQLSASVDEPEEERERIGLLKWFLTIFIAIPLCHIAGIIGLFQPQWWIGLIFLGLGVLLFLWWRHTVP